MHLPKLPVAQATARTGFGKSWIVLEISECIFRALGSFGKLVVVQLGYGKSQ